MFEVFVEKFNKFIKKNLIFSSEAITKKIHKIFSLSVRILQNINLKNVILQLKKRKKLLSGKFWLMIIL